MAKRAMLMRPKLLAAIVLAAGLAPARHADALVNPSLQPLDLIGRYDVVLSATIAKIDEQQGVVTMEVTGLYKGALAGKQIVVRATESMVPTVAIQSLGSAVVAFVRAPADKPGRGHEVLFYTGSGVWHAGTVPDRKDLSRWQWTQTLDQNEAGLWGTFNGSEERFVEMMKDYAGARFYFPAKPDIQFRQDAVIDRLPKPVRGVALYDIDGDGRPDIYVCCEAGNRAYLQRDAMKFEPAQRSLGLDGVVLRQLRWG